MPRKPTFRPSGRTLLAALALCATACETVVVVDVPVRDNLPVIIGRVIPGQQPAVRLSRSYPVLDDTWADRSLYDATVALFEDDVYVGPMRSYDIPGTYRLDTAVVPDFRPDGLRRYRVEVRHPELPPARAETLTPPAILPVALRFGDTVTLGGEEHLELLFRLEDPAGRSDFYFLELYAESGFFVGQVCYRNLEETFEGQPAFFPDFGQLPQYCGRVYFTDERFDGTAHEIRLLVPLEEGGFEGPVTAGTTFRVVLGLLSEDLYRYELAERLQQDTEGNPFAQPVIVPGNVEGGFGILGGFNAVAGTATL